MGTCSSNTVKDDSADAFKQDIETKNSKEVKASVEHPISIHSDIIYDIILTSNPSETVSCGADKTLVRYDWKQKTILHKWAHHSKSVDRLVFGEKSKYIFSGSRDSTIRQWHLNSKAEVNCFRGHTLPVSGLVINPDNTQLVSGSRDYSLRSWDIEKCEQIRMQTELSNVVTCMSWIPGEECVVQGAEDGSMRIWDVRSLEVAQKFEAGNNYALACDVNYDGTQFITSHNGADGVGGEVQIWDRRSRNILQVLKGHTHAVYDILYLPSQGKPLIASCSKDQTIRIWDQENNTCLSTTSIKKGSSEMRCLAVAPTRNPITLYSGNADGFISVWNVKPNGKLDCIAQSKRPAAGL